VAREAWAGPLFTQRRRAAEMLIGMSVGFLCDEIFRGLCSHE
jgi:hypothetical protein